MSYDVGLKMKTTVRNVLVCVVLFLPITARSSDDVLDVAVERVQVEDG
jgi:hypothetical protein